MSTLSIYLPIITNSNPSKPVAINYRAPMGVSGYHNLGNTCFLNSCIQILNHTYELSALYFSISKKENKEGALWDEYNSLVQATFQENKDINPIRFIKLVHDIAREKGKNIFTGWTQNDMPEFLLFMVDIMHQSLSRPVATQFHVGGEDLAKKCLETMSEIYSKEYSEIMDLFYGVYVSKIRSLESPATTSIKPEQFFILDLPIPSNSMEIITLYDCIELFMKPEILEDENLWFNEKTKRREKATKEFLFWSFPPILVICLKRFDHVGRKIHTYVDFPIKNLNLSSYVSAENRDIYNYDLFGVCNHMGTTGGGHYNAYVKSMVVDATAARWLCYDDINVSLIDDPAKMKTPTAYCLFYRRKNMIA